MPFSTRCLCIRGDSSVVCARITCFAAVLLLVCSGCGDEDESAANSGMPPGAAPPTPQVEVFAAIAQEVTDFREYTGRTVAVDSVELRPRVSGYLLQTPRSPAKFLARKRQDDAPESTGADSAGGESAMTGAGEFHDIIEDRPSGQSNKSAKDGARDSRSLFIVTAREGDYVAAGAPLFEIDPEPYRLAYLQAKANLDATEAELSRAQRQLERLRQLIADNAASSAEFDVAEATAAQAAGSVQNLRAVVDRAYLDWQYTQVRTPIAGMVGRSLITRGNLAVEDATILTTVVTMDPIYVNFTVDEASVLDYRRRIEEGSVKSALESTINVRMALANERGFPHRGIVDFVDNTTDPTTGNKLIRARFANPTGLITPGLFARVQIPFTAPYKAVLVPTVSIAADQQGRYVLMVDEAGTVRRQGIVTGPIQADYTIIREGVSEGQQVIVSGLQRARPGATVKSVPASVEYKLESAAETNEVPEPPNDEAPMEISTESKVPSPIDETESRASVNGASAK